MKAEELNRMYRKQAEALETEGKVKEAERLYLMINEPEIAINMYKKARMYADVVRLVRTHKPDELEATNLAFARVRPARTRPPNRTRTRTRNGNKVLYSTSTRTSSTCTFAHYSSFQSAACSCAHTHTRTALIGVGRVEAVQAGRVLLPRGRRLEGRDRHVPER